MNVKQIILKHLVPETMKRVLKEMGITRMNLVTADTMRKRLLDSPAATPEVMVEYLDLDQVRKICDEMGISFSRRAT